jgi:hypothetical protein
LEFEGPLGTSYRFDTEALDELFDVRSGSQHYIKLWQASVSFIGVFLDVPWVRVLRSTNAQRLQSNCALPLPGCKDGDVLRSLYGLCEIPSTPTGPYMESPRTKSTPRSATSAQPYTIVEKGKRAMCNAPLGVVIQVDISATSLSPFELRHGDRLLVLRGTGSGRMATVIGVASGTLVVHIDGEAKVTIVRGCTTAEEVSAQFARPKGSATSSRASSIPQQSPPRQQRGKATDEVNVNEKSVPSKSLASSSNREAASAQRSTSRLFRCWTAFGRYEFDASDAAIQHFGPFSHEETLRCTRGVDSNTLFNVVGVRSGVLWVIGENKTRAVPLTHCTDKASVERQYGFVHVGKASLKSHNDRAEEPPITPFNSPRSRAQSANRIGDDESPRVDSHSAAPRTLPVPPIAGLQLARQLAPALDAVATVEQDQGEPEPSPRASLADDHQHRHAELPRNIVPLSSPPVASAVADKNLDKNLENPEAQPSVALVGGSGQSARNYLKAVAMFMLGTTNQHRTPLPFHEYYAVDPTRRLGAALRKLDQTRDAWSRLHPVKPFSEATVEDILRLFSKFPQLLP